MYIFWHNQLAPYVYAHIHQIKMDVLISTLQTCQWWLLFENVSIVNQEVTHPIEDKICMFSNSTGECSFSRSGLEFVPERLFWLWRSYLIKFYIFVDLILSNPLLPLQLPSAARAAPRPVSHTNDTSYTNLSYNLKQAEYNFKCSFTERIWSYM